MRIPRGAWIALATVVVLAAFAAGVLSYLSRSEVEPARARNEDVQRKRLSEYLEDLDFVAGESFFAGRKAIARDASSLLNSRLKWMPAPPVAPPDSDEGRREAKMAVHGRKPLFDAASSDRLLRMRFDWIQHPGAFRLTRPDFSILKDAMRFDGWNLETNSPIAALAARREYVPPSTLPSPDGMEFIGLIKLRLLKAMDDGEWIPALREARHAAELMWSTESLQLQLAALSALDSERRAYRHYVEQNMIDEADWKPIDRMVTRRAGRALLATRGYLRLLTPEDAFAKVFFDDRRAPIGLCAAANEAFPIEWSLKPLLDGAWPGEKDLRPNYARLDRAWQKTRELCRVIYLKALYEGKTFDPELPVPALFRAVPWSRQLFGLKLATLNFVGFEGYESANR